MFIYTDSDLNPSYLDQKFPSIESKPLEFTQAVIYIMDVVVGEDAGIHEGDIVRVGSKSKGDYGMVAHVPGLSYAGDHLLPAGTFRIFRLHGTIMETTEARDITLVDRTSFFHGQFVVEIGAGWIGVITEVHTALDLVRLGHGEGEGEPAVTAMAGVSPGALRRVRELSLGDFVASGPWLGRVVEVALDLVVVFDDGAACKVVGDARSDKLRLLDPAERVRGQMNTSLYPGQRVAGPRASPAQVFKDCQWLSGHWKPSHKEATIAKVEMAGVLVHWIASAHHGTDQRLIQASAPPVYQDPKNLTFFCSDFLCSWGLGDRCLVRDTEETREKEQQEESARLHRTKNPTRSSSSMGVGGRGGRRSSSP